MNVPRGVLVQRHTLQQYVVVLLTLKLRQINDLVYVPLYFERVRVHLLTDFALETLPVKRPHVLIIDIRCLLLLLDVEPLLEALEVDEANGSFTLAGDDEGVGGVVLRDPADTALNLVLVTIVLQILHTRHLLHLIQIIILQLSF